MRRTIVMESVWEDIMDRNDTFYSLMVLLAAILWGTTGTSQYFAPEGASPLSIGSVRLVIGGVALFSFALFRGVLKNTSLWKNINSYIAAGFIAAYQLFFFAAVLKTGVAVGTVVGIGSSPVFAGLISLIIRRENPGLKWTIATLVSVAGCFLLITGGEELMVNISGIVLALGAGLSYAFYSAFSKDLLAANPPEAVAGVVFAIGAALLIPFLLLYDLSWLFTSRGMGVAIHLGVITTALAYVLFSYGLSKISLHKAVTLTLAEPLMASALGLLVLKEQLTSVSQTGMLLVFLGLIILSIPAMTIKNKTNI